MINKIQGDIPQGSTDQGTSNPIKVGGLARRTNPAAVEDNTRVGSMHDDLGRQVITLHQVRDLIATAFAEPVSAAEVTLLSGVASTFLDLIEITGANSSATAFSIDIRDATGGGIIKTLVIPANNTIKESFTVPIPQNTLAAAWTVQIRNPSADLSNPSVLVSATFIKNV